MNTLTKLELPKRWELLEQRAQAAGLDAGLFVERVDSAADRIDYLLQRVKTGGGGLFEVFYGLSGSGKTTFLKTLPKQFQQIRVSSFPKDMDLSTLPTFIHDTYVPGDTSARVILIERRDNPSQRDIQNLSETFAELLEVFRDPKGAALVLWPVTREPSAHKIAEEAWTTGRDSMADTRSRGFYNFTGLPKERFYAVADTTTRNLTGDGLETFGVTPEVANDLLAEAQTIADFFNAVDLYAEMQREKTWSILKTKVRARLWVVLPGDVPSAIRSTVLSLTQGSRNRVDIELVAEFIDQPDEKAPIYVADWKARRSAMAHILRAIDLRLFELPPNVSLAAVRAYGEASVKEKLKQPAAKLEDAKTAMRNSKLYKEIEAELGINKTPFAGASRDVEETSNEYRRIQAVASKGDKSLNKAIGLLLSECLKEDAPTVKVVSEKQSLPNCDLKPDVCLHINDLDYICIEPTWRSTDKGIPGELDGGQNTLAASHMKKYLLDKAMQYIKALGI
ncbi:hypothetical protein [Castellaniella defragrans]|uniref:GTPase SAR1 family protein n=1 Tax=Castellaniella defragrans TaxID=75697 RepID=A0A7W9WMT8_CASDE|nr:hypothetical protein [Castellaniella defragrans]KAB0615672.1 hypothetical protein F7Q88_08665 [Castellaniella defragrans]MBB6084682.1 GTPase SAR1 family protein [Castellaniella defragrans]